MHPLVLNISNAARSLAAAVEAEQALEDARIGIKMAAVERIMQAGDNPMTGKPHSFSSAEAVVGTDPAYAAHLAAQRAAVKERILARGQYDVALAAARLEADRGE